MKERAWWGISAVLILVLVGLWARMNEYHVNPPRLVKEEAVDGELGRRS